MSGIKEIILERSSFLKNEIIELRRYFHAHPELSFNEKGTALFIDNYLKNVGIGYIRGVAGTGIIGLIKGENGSSGKTVAVRAEMDALPITETNETSYKSQNTGIMHACGHDANLAMLLGVTRILSDMKESFGGTFIPVFQPGEEKSPGGAKLLLDTGELDIYKPDYIVAQHALPELESGKAGFKSGIYMASCDEIYINVIGKGGHAALPGLTTDQIYIASKLIIKLKEVIAAKQKANNIPTVLGIGRISGEGATNVIPSRVDIDGTFRTFNEKWRGEALEIIKAVSYDIAGEFGISVIVNIEKGYPVLVNDEQLTEKAITLSGHLLGKDNIVIYSDQRMSSDDFSFYSALAPSVYFRYGIREKEKEMRRLHTSDFDIDENGLESATANLCWIVLNLMEEG
jgi:amidohydrolase